MALEYRELSLAAFEEAELVLNEMAADGWRVHTAYSPTHFLLERGSPPRARDQAQSPPTGTKG